MKFRLLLLLFPVLFLNSCGKDNDDYFVKAKINGNWVTWKKVAGELGPDLANASKTDLGVHANDEGLTQVFDISIQVDGPNFNTGTYVSDNFTGYYMLVSYVTDANTNNPLFYDIQDAPNRPSSKYTVNISSITDEVITGTFTGNYLYEYSEDKVIDMTEGEFRVKRIR